MAFMDHVGYYMDETARAKCLIFHVIHLPAEDNSHEISSFICPENVNALSLAAILMMVVLTLLRPMVFSIKLIQRSQDLQQQKNF